jgi:hypothetical protein
MLVPIENQNLLADVRLIAIDLDGTLLSPSGTVTPRTYRAVHDLIEAGVIVCFATGRNFTESRDVLSAVGHYDLAVFVGGAMVVDCATGQPTHVQRMTPALAAELSQFFEDAGQAVCALQHRDAAGVDYVITSEPAMNRAMSRWLEVTRSTHRLVRRGHLGCDDHAHTIRVGVVAPSAEVDLLERRLHERFAGRVISHAIHIPAYGVHALEVFDPVVSKWSGVNHVARIRGVAEDQIAAVGDDVNDLPMLRAARVSAAMGNAHPAAKAAAKRVIGANAEDGLAAWLEQITGARRSASGRA